MRERRKERKQILTRVFSEGICNIYADSLKYETV